jgi:hypothetical protein
MSGYPGIRAGLDWFRQLRRRLPSPQADVAIITLLAVAVIGSMVYWPDDVIADALVPAICAVLFVAAFSWG